MGIVLQNIRGTAAYLDDILIIGTDYANIKKMDMILRRVADYGFRPRAEKFDYNMEQLRYSGFIAIKKRKKT